MNKDEDHVFPSGDASTGERQDTIVYDFTFDIPEVVFRKMSERAKCCHFSLIGAWRPGMRVMELKCVSREITQVLDSWKKFPEITGAES